MAGKKKSIINYKLKKNKMLNQKFIISSTALYNVLKTLSALKPKRPVLEILNYVHAVSGENEITFTATNLETSLMVNEQAEYKDKIDMLIPFECMKYLSKIDDQHITIKSDEQLKLSVSTNDGEVNYATENTNDFPKTPGVSTCIIKDFPFNEKQMSGLSTFVSANELRPVLTGVCMDWRNNKPLKFIATDAHVLKCIATEVRPASYKYEDKDADGGINHTLENQIIVPGKAWKLLCNMLKSKSERNNITVHAQDNTIRFSWNISQSYFVKEYSLQTRIIPEKYVDYNSVIPKDNTNILLIRDKKDLMKKLNESLLFSQKKDPHVRFDITKDKFEISSENYDFNKEYSKLIRNYEWEGEEFIIGFNAKLLLVCLKSLNPKDNSVVFKMSKPKRAVLVRDILTENETTLIMPVLIASKENTNMSEGITMSEEDEKHTDKISEQEEEMKEQAEQLKEDEDNDDRKKLPEVNLESYRKYLKIKQNK